MHNTPTQVTYRAPLLRSESIDARIEHHIAKLEKASSRIIGCHVTLDAPHRHQRHGRQYAVRIEIGVPGHLLVVNRHPVPRKNHEDLYAAIDDAFDDAARLVACDRTRRRH